LAAFLLPTLALLAGAGYAGYAVTRSILDEELGRSLSATAAAAAAQLSAERLLSIEPDDDQGEGTRTFRNIHRDLTDLRLAVGARRVFAFDADGRVRVDAGGSLPVGAEVPELARDRLELSRVFAGERAASQVMFEGTDGRLYKTGYAPLMSHGKAVAAVGVEGSAEFFGPLFWLYRAYAMLVGAALAILAMVAVLTARNLAAPLNRLVKSALAIGAGDLETPVPSEPTREIGILSRELEAMRKALQSRDTQLKMMLAGVAHEVRNPIGGIELFAGLAAEEQDVGELKHHVGRIQKEIDYLKRIVEDFLTFARDQKLARAPLQARELVLGAAELMRAEAAGKGVTLEAKADEATVEVDQALVLAAMVNLVKNAVQASSAGTTVEVSGTAQEGRYLVRVSDHGVGIAPEVQEKIFEPFFTTREKGTGLGLPLARKIAQAHGGDLELESRPGATTFCLTLPR
jgi:signal transduction histidine kinase